MITVITSVYNGAGLLQRCIDSVAGQSYPHREHVIIDGGSTDGTRDIIRANADCLGYWVSERDEGIYDAWNKGVRHARGDWLLFLGSDDFLWNSSSLESIGPALESALPQYPLVYGVTVVVDSEGRAMYHMGEPWQGAQQFRWRMKRLPNPSTFYHKSLFTKYGLFDKRLQYAGDYEYWLRTFRHEEALFVQPAKIAGFQAGGVSNRDSTVLKSLHEAVYARRKNGYPPIPVDLCLEYGRVAIKLAIGRVLGRNALATLLKSYRTLKYSRQRPQVGQSEKERGY